MSLVETAYDSPVGRLRLVASDVGLVAITWPNDRIGRVRFDEEPTVADHPVLVTTSAQLDEYFAGSRRAFDLPLDLRGTDLQVKTWLGLADIAYGTTVSYSEQAARLGRPTATRAVAAANGANPVSIVLPCHRVIAKSGALTGFAGGLDTKAWLLDHEASR